MSTAVRVPLSRAEAVSAELIALLSPAAERVEVAGSIRRRSPDIGDIELVAIPRYHVEAVAGLWGAEESEVNDLHVLVTDLLTDGTLLPHPTDPKRGERYSKVVHAASGLQVDLFAARPETFGLIFLIRTGPAAYSQWLVTAARSKGFHVAEGELHRGSMAPEVHVRCERVPVPGEADVYTALGLAYTRPEDRR